MGPSQRPRAFPATPGNWSAGSMASSGPAPSPTNRCRPSSTASRCACLPASASSRAGPAVPAQLVAGREIMRSHYEMIVDRSAGLALGQEVPLGTHGHKFTVVGLMDRRDHVVRRSRRATSPCTTRKRCSSSSLPRPSGASSRAAGRCRRNDQINAVIAKVSPYVPINEVAAALSRWKHLTTLTQDAAGNLVEQVCHRERRASSNC